MARVIIEVLFPVDEGAPGDIVDVDQSRADELYALGAAKPGTVPAPSPVWVTSLGKRSRLPATLGSPLLFIDDDDQVRLRRPDGTFSLLSGVGAGVDLGDYYTAAEVDTRISSATATTLTDAAADAATQVAGVAAASAAAASGSIAAQNTADQARAAAAATDAKLGYNVAGRASTLAGRLIDIENQLVALRNTTPTVPGGGTTPTPTPPGPAYRRGVALAGHDFGTDQLTDGTWFRAGNPGALNTDYFMQPATSWAYLRTRGVDLVRLLVQWERLQPTLLGTLSTAEAARVATQLQHAADNGIRVILTIANDGRYLAADAVATNGRVRKILGGGGSLNLPDAALADLWTKLSQRFASHPAVHGYALANEPHDFPTNTTGAGYTAAITRGSFDSTTEGWNGGGATLARDTAVKRDGAASLKATQVFGDTAYGQFRIDDGGGGADRTIAGQGLTWVGYVRVPAATPGNWFAQWRVYDAAFTETAGAGSATITAAEKDTWVEVRTTFTAAQLTNCRSVTLQVNTDGGLPAVGTYTINLDTVTQGTVAAGSTITGRQRWHRVSQLCVDAVRANGDTTLIVVPGYQYGGVQTWTANNGSAKWIVDPAGNTRYEAHHFFDPDNSGDYATTIAGATPETYANTLADATSKGHTAGGNTDALHTKVLAELKVFTDWLTANQVKGLIGEVGWPGTADTGLWNALGKRWYDAADAAELDVTYAWAWPLASSNIAAYDATTEPSPLNRERPPATIVESHLTPGVVTPPAPAPPPPPSGQGVLLTAAVPATVQLPAKVAVTVTVRPAVAALPDALINVELTKDGVKAAQQFTQGVNIPKDADTSRTFELQAPTAGVYTVNVGVFDSPAPGGYDWGTKRAGIDGIATVTVAAAPVYIPPATGTLYRAPQTVDAYASTYPELRLIADQPIGLWLGEWSGDVYTTVSNVVTAAAGKTAMFVLYNIPGRDAGNYSAGGLSGPTAYNAWIAEIARGLGGAPAILTLEPDALGLMGGLSTEKRNERLTMFRAAVATFKAKPNVKVFVEAPMWVPTSEMAGLLASVTPTSGPRMDGVALNTSGHVANAQCHSYGDQLSAATGGLKYIIDTSRNGKGEGDGWCNPPGRGLGKKPTLTTGNPNCYAYLWLKVPGESDGQCNGGPSAGTFWLEKAQELIANRLPASEGGV